MAKDNDNDDSGKPKNPVKKLRKMIRSVPVAMLTTVAADGYSTLKLTTPPISIHAYLETDRGNIVVLRSFGKFFGLAGLRLGFALAAPHLAATLSASLGPWAVSGPAIAIGERPGRRAERRSSSRTALSRMVRR